VNFNVWKFGKLNMLTYNHSEVGNLRKQHSPLMLSSLVSHLKMFLTKFKTPASCPLTLTNRGLQLAPIF
ncbi:MAG: hypothetical protein ACTS5A_04060, partial [Candidatus Hodgkinia cicadicola]